MTIDHSNQYQHYIPSLATTYSKDGLYMAQRRASGSVNLFKKVNGGVDFVQRFEGESSVEVYGCNISFPSECQLEVHSWLNDGTGRRFKYTYTEVTDDQWVLSSKGVVDTLELQITEEKPTTGANASSFQKTSILSAEEKMFLEYVIREEELFLTKTAYFTELKKKLLSKT